jgi:hypothetical protein
MRRGRIGLSEKYVWIDERDRYVIIASNGDRPYADFTTMVSVTSESLELGMKVAKEFEARSGIPLRDAPASVVAKSSFFLDGMFHAAMRCPEEAMRVLGV